MKKAALIGLAALTALSCGPLIPLVSERGEPLTGLEADAEGLDILPTLGLEGVRKSATTSSGRV